MMPPDTRFREYLFSYRYQGSLWGFSVMATSEQDAKFRLARMADAQVDGVLGGRIPAGPDPLFTGFVMSLICWFRNRI